MNKLEQFILDNHRVWPYPDHEAAWVSGYGSAVTSITKTDFLKRIAEENRPAFSVHSDAKCFACDEDGSWFKNRLTSKVKTGVSAWLNIEGASATGWVRLQKGRPIGGWKESLMIRTEKKQFTKADLKDGMKLTCSDGSERILLGKAILIALVNGDLTEWNDLDNYLDDLCVTETAAAICRYNCDIVKVMYMGELIWERPEPKPEPTDREMFVNNLRKWVTGVSYDEDLEALYDKGFRYMGELYE